MSAPSAWRLEQVMSIAQSTAQRLRAEGLEYERDESALFAALESEGIEAEELIKRLIRASAEAAAQAAAAEARIADLSLRQERFAGRAKSWRAAALAAMDALQITKIGDPEFTATLSAGKPGVVITDEAAIPEEYIRVTRTPDKAAIRDAVIKHGVVVPGTAQANGTPTLTVRTK